MPCLGCILLDVPWIVPVSGSGGVCVRAVASLTGGCDVEVVGAGPDSGSGASASPNVVTQARTVTIHHRLLGQGGQNKFEKFEQIS